MPENCAFFDDKYGLQAVAAIKVILRAQITLAIVDNAQENKKPYLPAEHDVFSQTMIFLTPLPGGRGCV
ncbi:MAG: hypothetical protein HZA50_15520 [Planctomycetes bacterium]|nr:hypothetical protein [Planctomycetota bacterium]